METERGAKDMAQLQADGGETGRIGTIPELPGIIVAAAIVVSACIAIGRLGMPEIAVPFAAPTFLTAMLALTTAWVCGGQARRWWLPLFGLAMPVAVAFALAFSSADAPRGSYVWLMPALIVVMTGATAIYWLIGVRSVTRSAADATRPGAGATVAFWLLVIAAPVWTAFLLLISVLDTPYEDVLTIPLLLSTSLGSLVAVLGAGLAAAPRRSSVTIGAVLLSVYALIALVDLVTGSDAAVKLVLLLGAAAACALAWRRAYAGRSRGDVA